MLGRQLIELSDGVLVEIDTAVDQMEKISGKLAEKVHATFDKIQPILTQVCHPVINACKDISTEAGVEQAEIELGLSFEAEGNLYVTKTNAGANIVIRMVIKPRERSS